MKRLLITGSTSKQVSDTMKVKVPTFSGNLAKLLRTNKVNVVFVEPSADVDPDFIDTFDSVLVGIASPTSMSANKVFSALHIARVAQDMGKLRLFVDAPEPYKVAAGISALVGEPEKTTSDIFSKRRDFDRLSRDANFRRGVEDFLQYLHEEPWPKTLYPCFTWSVGNASLQKMVKKSYNLVPTFVDHDVLTYPAVPPGIVLAEHLSFWTCDDVKTPWSKKLEKTLHYPVLPVRKSKWESWWHSTNRIEQSLGTLISVYRSGESWWSPWLALALSRGVPVASDWRLTASLGPDWTHLPSTIETLMSDERFELASRQRDSFVCDLPKKEDCLEQIMDGLFY